MPRLVPSTYLNERCAAVTNKASRLFTVQHELAQNTNTKQDDTANVVSPLEDLVPARPIMRHVSEALVF